MTITSLDRVHFGATASMSPDPVEIRTHDVEVETPDATYKVAPSWFGFKNPTTEPEPQPQAEPQPESEPRLEPEPQPEPAPAPEPKAKRVVLTDRGDDYAAGDAGEAIVGLGGGDVLTGGAGADRFAFVAETSYDRVRDFEDGVDRRDYARQDAVSGFEDLTIRDFFGSALVMHEGGGGALLLGVRADALAENDFVY